MAEKLAFETKSLTEQNIEKLKQLFPEIITEAVGQDGKIKHSVNFEKLKQILSGDIAESRETYDFIWAGKGKAMQIAAEPIRKTLRPCKEDSVNWNNTENIYIEGDNLDALKLLQESYLGKIKMIYIDPPYNTGNDFIYKDKFAQTQQEYEKQTEIKDDEGNILFKNLETNGRFHSDWCSMIYPRLKIARNLLSEDGVIFISIHDVEVANLTKICDEIFGCNNKIALICHKSRGSISNDKVISLNHNIILFYAKDIEIIEAKRKMVGLDQRLEEFDLNDNDGKGAYKLVPVDAPGGAKKGNPYYTFLGVKGYWRFSQKEMQKKYEQGLVLKKGNSFLQKYYKSTAEKKRRTISTWWEIDIDDPWWWDKAGLISSATARLKKLMGGDSFDNPKPVELIDRMLRLITFEDKESIILDFFSGSATTAHAVMKLNDEDGSNRKFIMVQSAEELNPKLKEHKTAFEYLQFINKPTIMSEIGKERIRRAAAQIQKDNPNAKFDGGFRVFKVADSNMKDVYYSPEEYSQDMLSQITDNIKEDRTDLDLLYGCILQLGMPISCKHEEITYAGIKIYSAYNQDTVLIACFEKKITQEAVIHIAEQKPNFAVFRDSSFNESHEKISMEELFKKISPNTTIRVI